MNDQITEINWQEVSQDLANAIEVNQLHSDVIAKIKTASDSKIAIACSAGIDSVCLTLLLYGHFKQLRNKFVILHLNHATRGIETDKDQLFAESLANQLNLEFITEKAEIKAAQNLSENNLRKIRHAFFEKSLKQIHSTLLILGHQKDDIAETILMRLLRGSGIGGLSAPRAVHFHTNSNKTHLRPLLTISRSEIVTAMENSKAIWREDVSNNSEDYFRNRIRHKIIPALKSISKQNVADSFAQSRKLLEESDDALKFYLDAIYPKNSKDELNVSFLKNQPKAIFREALHRWFIENHINNILKREAFEQFLTAVFQGNQTKISCGDDLFINFNKTTIKIIKLVINNNIKLESIKLSLNSTTYFPDKSSLKIEQIELNEVLKNEILEGKVDNSSNAYLVVGENTIEQISIRLWKAGDRYKPIGAPGSRKLKDQFVDRKISQEDRKNLPVICFDDHPVWVPGLIPADETKIFPTTTTALRLTYNPFYARIDT